MVQESGEKKGMAQKEALGVDVTADLKFPLPEEALVVNPFRTDGAGNDFPREQRYEIERKFDSTIFPFLGPGRHIMVKIVGAAEYLDKQNKNSVVYQISVWKRRPYRAAVESMRKKGYVVDHGKMAAMGYDHEREMKKSRWQAAWAYDAKKLQTDDIQLAVDAMKEIIDDHNTIVDVATNIQQEIYAWRSQSAAARGAVPPSWIIEEDTIINPSSGLMGKIGSMFSKSENKKKRKSQRKARKKNRR
jgi:hypothetical protein